MKAKEILKNNTPEDLYSAWCKLDSDGQRVISDLEFYISLGHIMRCCFLDDSDLEAYSKFDQEEMNKVKELTTFIVHKSTKTRSM